ncbi:MAG: GntR family transcriptional regulator [Halocynthiibacter sp.]
MTATIADTIYDTLRRQIVTGELGAGEKLRQDHIARAFDTSHVPVREALLRLEAHGLAHSLPRRGMRVTALDPTEIREVIEMRISLEVLALQFASPVITPAELEVAEKARLLCDEADDIVTWEQRNRAFHWAILKPCRMPRLLATIDDLHTASARHLFANQKQKWTQRQDKDHASIMVALRRKDTQVACDILRRHLKRVK